MTFQQQEDNFFEIEIPVFCEWILTLCDDSGDKASLKNYTNGLIKDDDSNILLSTAEYSLPGFPGIKYFLNIYLEEDHLWIEFTVRQDYKKYNFDADFNCTLTDCEPKHFVRTFSNVTDIDNRITSFELCHCPGTCGGCTVCFEKNIVISVEGKFTVKYVEAYKYLPVEISNETRNISIERKSTKDFVVISKEKEIRVHKSVLIEHSSVFARMFDCENWKETMENKIQIPDFSYYIVKAAIDSCYNLAYDNQLERKEEYLSFFQFADKYDMQKLIEAVKKCIAFTPFNVVEYANFFLQNNAIELIDCCIDYILSCSQYSLPMKDIETLDAEIQGMFFNRVLVSPILKKDAKTEHRNYNFENDGYQG